MALPDIWRGERGLWSPVREMNRLQRRINRMFDDLYETPEFPGLFHPARTMLPAFEVAAFEPACDIEETDKAFLLTFDLPGIKKDDVKIALQDNQLTISGERKEETKRQGTRERFYGSFSRSFTLPANVNAEKVQANYENGVLQVSLPKIAVTSGKQIPIQEGKRIEGKAEKAA